MNRIDKVFGDLRQRKALAVMPFLVGGFPDLKKSLSLLKTLSKEADLLEIGFPYSDPLADGPVIQAANTEVLNNKITVSQVFGLIKKLRQTTDVPITVLAYANLVYQRGIEQFYQDAAKAGIDGVLIPDLPAEEFGPFAAAANKTGVLHICLVSTVTTKARLKTILKSAQGYIYLTSVLGVTGARKDIPKSTLKYLKTLTKKMRLPVAVGFGISNRGQVASLKKNGAAGAIVGSALINIAQEHGKSAEQEMLKFLRNMLK